MKKIFAGIVLPTLAAAAVIGSGFSIWFFGENQDKVSTNADVAVERILRIGDLTADSKVGLLHLDQTKEVRKKILETNNLVNTTEKDGNFDKKSNFAGAGSFGTAVAAKGLYLTEKTAGEAFNGEITYEGQAETSFDTHLQAVNVEIKTTFKFTGGLENFVGMDKTTAPDSWETTTTAGEYVFNWGKASVSETRKKTLAMDPDTITGTTPDFKFVYVNYADQYSALVATNEIDPNRATTSESVLKTAEPHTDKEYNAMLAAVKDGHLTIETVATLAE